MADNPFPEWLAEVATDAIVVRPDDTTAEARGNMWSFGLSDEQRAAVGVTEVVDFVRSVVAARGRWLTERGSAPMRFYCWHDAQTGQLRFSLVSATGSGLPFECPIELVSVVRPVVLNFLAPTPESARAPLLVWVTFVP